MTRDHLIVMQHQVWRLLPPFVVVSRGQHTILKHQEIFFDWKAAEHHNFFVTKGHNYLKSLSLINIWQLNVNINETIELLYQNLFIVFWQHAIIVSYDYVKEFLSGVDKDIIPTYNGHYALFQVKFSVSNFFLTIFLKKMTKIVYFGDFFCFYKFLMIFQSVIFS